MTPAAGSAATNWLGIEIEPPADGGVVLSMPTRAEMANRGGVVHGGFIALLADSAMGRAMSSAQAASDRHFSFDLKLSFITTATVGEPLRAVATVLHAGSRTGVAECRVEGPGGRLVATATGTFISHPLEPEGPVDD